MAHMRSSSPIRNETELLLEADLSIEDLQTTNRGVNFRIEKPTPLARTKKFKERASLPNLAERREDRATAIERYRNVTNQQFLPVVKYNAPQWTISVVTIFKFMLIAGIIVSVVNRELTHRNSQIELKSQIDKIQEQVENDKNFKILLENQNALLQKMLAMETTLEKIVTVNEEVIASMRNMKEELASIQAIYAHSYDDSHVYSAQAQLMGDMNSILMKRQRERKDLEIENVKTSIRNKWNEN